MASIWKSKTWSLTIGNGGENHTGMEFLGNLRKKGEGWDIDTLLRVKSIAEHYLKKKVELINLNEYCLEGVEIPEKCEKPKDAYLMIIRNYFTKIFIKILLKNCKVMNGIENIMMLGERRY